MNEIRHAAPGVGELVQPVAPLGCGVARRVRVIDKHVLCAVLAGFKAAHHHQMAVGTARRALQQRQAAFFSMLRRIRVMHAHPTRKPVFYLFLQSGDIRKGDIALISVAARNGGGKTPVAVARVCIIVVGVGHLFGQQVLAPTVHQHGDRGGAADDRADARVPDELRISGNRDAPVLKRFARFPLPARGTYGGGKQIYGGGTAHVH